MERRWKNDKRKQNFLRFVLFNRRAAPGAGVGAVTGQALPSRAFGSDAHIPSDGAVRPDVLWEHPRDLEEGASLQAEMAPLHSHLKVTAAFAVELSSGSACSQ